MKFTGTEKYVATDDLQMAVNAAITLQRPLLIKGEPVLQSFKQVEEFAQTGGHLGPPDFEKEINQHRVLLLLNFSCDDGP